MENTNVEQKGHELNKQDLVKMLYEDVMISTDAQGHRLTKAAANRVLNAVLDKITASLNEPGDKVIITGFGTFSVKTRAAHMGRNPQTNQPQMIEESTYCKFKPGSSMKFKKAENATEV